MQLSLQLLGLVGLGIALSPMDAPSVKVSSFMNTCGYNLHYVCKKGRPSQLVLSPSDGALKVPTGAVICLNLDPHIATPGKIQIT